jgi:hypothetical protein
MTLEAFLTMVRTSSQFSHLYHFTDVNNLSSIRSRGLLSTAELRRLQLLSGVVTGGDMNSLNSDIQTGTDNYVCLCLTKNHPMSFRAAERGVNPVYLSINPEIINLPGVMVTNAASNQIGVVKQPLDVGLDELHLDSIYKWVDWTKHPEVYEQRKLAEKYEILVPKQIAVPYIVGGL